MGKQSELTFQSLDVAAVQIDGKREYQEDAYKILLNETNPPHMLSLLADGMGGHAAGDIAANLAIDVFSKSLSLQDHPCHEQFMHCLDKANRALSDAVSQNSKYAGMGCTFVGLEIYNNQCHWISVGDSPLFHISENGVKRVNADHSMASQLDAAAKMGEITQEEARNSSSRNVLLSALTGDKISRMDYSRTPLIVSEGDWLILASDGIETISPEELKHIIDTPLEASAEAISKAILSEIIKRDKPKQDNATAIVIHINQSGTDEYVSDDEIRTRPIMR